MTNTFIKLVKSFYKAAEDSFRRAFPPLSTSSSVARLFSHTDTITVTFDASVNSRLGKNNIKNDTQYYLHVEKGKQDHKWSRETQSGHILIPDVNVCGPGCIDVHTANRVLTRGPDDLPTCVHTCHRAVRL